jgi:hypothetical protein
MSPNTAEMKEVAALLKTLLGIVDKYSQDMTTLIQALRGLVHSVAPFLEDLSRRLRGLTSVMNNHNSDSGATQLQQSSQKRYYAVKPRRASAHCYNRLEDGLHLLQRLIEEMHPTVQ